MHPPGTVFFTLEALRAKKGDALLVHYGSPDDPVLLVVDGGPAGVYRQSLRPALEALRRERAPGGALPIRLLMVSHIDDDHIHGVLDFADDLRERVQDRREPEYRIERVWHNAFDDVVGSHAEQLRTAAVRQVGEASLHGEVVDDASLSGPARLVLASVGQGRALRDACRLLGLPVNDPGGGLIVARGDGAAIAPPLAEGLDAWVVSPGAGRVEELQREWDEYLERKELSEEATVDVAAYLDRSVFNLASIVVLLRAGGREMLLTGDARGDDVLEGLAAQGLLDDDGRRRLDVLKLPHHGSDRNVEVDFFRALPADHYVVSGDGSHGNPEPATFEMLFEARRDDDRPFTLHLTYEPERFRSHHGKPYPVASLRALFEKERAGGRPFRVRTPDRDATSLRIDLLDPYQGP